MSALLAGILGGCAMTEEDLEIGMTEQALIGGLECEVIDINMSILERKPPTLNSCFNDIISTEAIITARVRSSSVPEEHRKFEWTINEARVTRFDGIYRPRSEDGCSASECSISVMAPCSDERVFTFRVFIKDQRFPDAPALDSTTATATIPGVGVSACMPVPTTLVAPPLPPLPGDGGGGGGGGGEWECEIVFAEEICTNFPASPIIFDLGEVGYDLTDVGEGVKFDIDADGEREQVSWTARGSDDAFLALDRDGNGQIDDGGELFGTATRLSDGTTGAHGYIPLAELDLEANGGNENGYIDFNDRRSGRLLLWTDRDHDGRSSSPELRYLSDRDIFAIALDADESDVIDEYGNLLAYVSPAFAWRRGRIERIRTTDVFFWYRELGSRRGR